MTIPSLDPDRVAQHVSSLRQMDVEGLVHLWATSGEGDWTPEGLEAIRRLLRERIGYVPEKKPLPSGTSEAQADTFHDRDRLITLSIRLGGLSWVFLVLAALALLPVVVGVFSWGAAADAGLSPVEWVQYYGGYIVNGLQSGLVSLALFLVMKAGSEAMFVLMDIEHNTRGK